MKRVLSFFLSLVFVFGMFTWVGSSAEAASPVYSVSSSYRDSEYYDRLLDVELTGNYRTDLINVALSQVGYHEGDSTSELHGGSSSGSNNYTEYGYWFGREVKGNSYGHYYAWCAMFISWCARQAQIPTSVISNAAYAHADGSSSSGQNVPLPKRCTFLQHPQQKAGSTGDR